LMQGGKHGRQTFSCYIVNIGRRSLPVRRDSLF
jgi:hypothetical protein